MYSLSLRHTLPDSHTSNCEDLTFTTLCIPTTAPGVEVRRCGSAVIIRKEISHKEDIKIEKAELQFTSAKIKTTSSIITVAAIFSPPRRNLKRQDYLNLLQSFSGKFILGGDFNSKNTHWSSRLTTTKGCELYHAIKRHNCEVHTTG